MKRTVLAHRTPLKRGQRLARGGGLKPSRKRQPVTPPEWREGLEACVVCGTSLDLDGHHALPKRLLRVLGLGAFLWDLRGRVPVCRRHHERHENRTEPLVRELLPDSVWDIADELGLRWYVEKHYPSREEVT